MAQSVSSGTLWLMGSEAAFMLSNYLIHIGLARHLGAEAYGIFGVLMSLYLINRAFLNTGLPRAVSKFLSEFPDKAGAIFKTSLRVQLVVAILFALVYILFAPFIARMLNDVSLTHYIIFIGIMVIPLALLALYTSGYLNGLRMFREQAYVKTAYPILRVIFTIVFVWLGWALWGALAGYLFAILVSLFWSRHLLSHVGIPSGTFSSKRLIMFALPICIGSLAFTLLRNVNVLFLKSILADNRIAGLYTAAFTLSTIPAFIFAALPLSLTPSVSKAVAEGNFQKVRNYIQQSVRYLLLFLFPITALMAATGNELLTLFYPAEYSAAGAVLALLVVSSTLLTLFSLLSSIITGSGNPRFEMTVAISVMGVMAALNLLLIPRYGMMGTAWASVITGIAAATVSAIYVSKKFHAFVSPKSLIRIAATSVLIFLLGYYWHYTGVALAVNYVSLGFLYLGLLYLFGELKKADMNLVRKVLGRR